MESWLNSVLYGGVAITIILGATILFRRLLALRSTAGKLGMRYIGRAPKLADTLKGTMPMFCKGEPDCDKVIKGRAGEAEFYIFDYAWTGVGDADKSARKQEGVMVALYYPGKDFGARFQGKNQIDRKWKMEYGGAWLAMYPSYRGSRILLKAELLPVIKKKIEYLLTKAG